MGSGSWVMVLVIQCQRTLLQIFSIFELTGPIALFVSARVC
jgi:hypothetical protein